MRSQGPGHTDPLAASEEGLANHDIFHAAVDETRMAMTITDPNLPDCPLVYCNPAFTALTGYEAQDVVGQNCRFLQGAETDPAARVRIREALRAGKPLDEEIYNYRKDGTGFWNDLHLRPVFDGRGKLLYFFGSQADVSFRREASRRLAQRSESIDALASGIAHEFNNLMMIVMGNVEHVAGSVTDERQAKRLERTLWAVRRASRLTADLLSLAKHQANSDQVVDLNDAIRQCEPAVRRAAGEGRAVHFNLAPEVASASLPSGQLEQVLVNLVQNAADALGESGTITIATRVLAAPEAAALLDSPAALEVSVADTGAGMSPAVQERATELFFTTKTVGKGAGTGLFLALAFLDRAGGKLILESEPGKGTLVRMVLPLATDG